MSRRRLRPIVLLTLVGMLLATGNAATAALARACLRSAPPADQCPCPAHEEPCCPCCQADECAEEPTLPSACLTTGEEGPLCPCCPSPSGCPEGCVFCGVAKAPGCLNATLSVGPAPCVGVSDAELLSTVPPSPPDEFFQPPRA